MKREKELKALPSLLMREDGSLTEWEKMESREREALETIICEHVQEQMGIYFAARTEEWEASLLAIGRS